MSSAQEDLGDVSFPLLSSPLPPSPSLASSPRTSAPNSPGISLPSTSSSSSFSKLDPPLSPPSHPPSHRNTSFRTTSSSLVTPVNPKLYHPSSHRNKADLLFTDPPPPPSSPIQPTNVKNQKNDLLHFPSLFCVMTLGFFANVEYGVIMPSIWKYIDSLQGTEMEMGMAIAFCSAAQVFLLPIFGWWSDKRTMKEVYLFSLLLGILGNVMYASAQYFGSPWLVVAGRTLIGAYSGVISVSNSFIACVTTPYTRTRFMAHMNGVNALGLVTGPAFNLFLAKSDITILPDLKIDALTSPAWFVGALLCVSVLCFLVLFREPTHNPEAEGGEEKGDDESLSRFSPPSLSLSSTLSFLRLSLSKPWGVCFIITFVQNFDFSVLETCVTLYTTSIYGFTTFQNSLMYSAMSLEMIAVIVLTAVASKWVTDRVIILFGMLFMGGGVILLLVFFNHHSPFYVLIIIVSVLLVGLPSQNTAVMSCYSKLIDYEYPKAKQGLYSGVMMVFGSAARIVGPLWGGFATGLKSPYNTQIMATLLTGMFGLEFLVTLIFFRKLRVEQRLGYSINQSEQMPLLNADDLHT